MENELSPIEWLLSKIDRCNQELNRLEGDSEQANQRVNPMPWLSSDQIKITYKNKIELERDQYSHQLRIALQPYNLGLRSNAYISDVDEEGPKYLAFIDILGYSDIVQKNNHQELKRFVDLLIRDIQTCLVSEEVGKSKSRLYSYGFAPDLSIASINSILLSDTIIFWSKDDSANSFFELVRAIQIFMHFGAYFMNVAVRGAITVGEFTYNDLRVSHPQLVVDQSTIFGKAIVEAYNLEKKQEWLGCIVTKEAVDNFLSKTPTESQADAVFNKYIIKYPVPVKQLNSSYQKVKRWFKSLFGKLPVQEEYVIKWPRNSDNENGAEAIRKCFTRHQKLESIPQRSDVQKKYINTAKFAEYIIKQSDKKGNKPSE